MKAEGKIGAAGDRRDVVAGDHVYYQHPQHGLQHGEVVSVGRDGFRCRHARDGGGHDDVRWDSMLGHKLRKQRRFTIVDRGEDGAICEDEQGQRVFLRGDMPAPMAKSLGLPDLTEPMQLLALEQARAQMEQTTMIVAAMDRLAAALAAQSQRLDQLIALQVAAINSGATDAPPEAHPLFQGVQPADVQAQGAGLGPL